MMPTVTQVLGILRKIGLEMWYKQNTSEFCDAESKKGREVGSIIHSIIQGSIEQEEVRFETEYDKEVMFCLKGLAKFKKEHPELKFKRSEVEVISKKHGFLGHLDCLGEEKKELVLIDWKTGKCDVGKVSKSGLSKEKDLPPVYPEHMYQVAAYVAAYNEQERANIEQARVIVFAKDKAVYNYLPIHKTVLDRMFREVFLPALSIYNYQKEEENDNGYNSKRSGTGSTQKANGISIGKSAKLPAGF